MSALGTQHSAGSASPRSGSSPNSVTDWLPLAAPSDLKKPSSNWWLALLERALISRAMDDLEVTKDYRPNPDKPHEGQAQVPVLGERPRNPSAYRGCAAQPPARRGDCLLSLAPADAGRRA